MNNTKTFVDVIMPTYNHEEFIEEAIVSVLQQKCNFNFNIIISDDNSTDNTLKICKKFKSKFYDKIILLENKENIGLIKNYLKVFDICQSRYIAILESDDYWIDPYKLQKQVDIMEKYNSIGLVHTRSKVIFENDEVKVNYHSKQLDEKNNNLFEKFMLGKYPIAPLTVCFRRILLNYLDTKFLVENTDLKTIDLFLWPEFAMHTRFFFLNEITACYRNLSSSESNTNNLSKREEFLKSSQIIKRYYLEKYPSKRLNEKLVLSKGNYQMAWRFLLAGNYLKGKEYASYLPFSKIKFLWTKILTIHKILFPLVWISNNSIEFLSKIKQRIFVLISK